MSRLIVILALVLFAILNAATLSTALSLRNEMRTVRALRIERRPMQTPQILGPAIIDGYFVNRKGERWPVSSEPPPAVPTVPALDGPLRKLPDGTWAYRAASGVTWDDLTQAERDILRMPALCPDGWYSNPATAGTLCPEAIEFMANYDEYRAQFEADYRRRYP